MSDKVLIVLILAGAAIFISMQARDATSDAVLIARDARATAESTERIGKGIRNAGDDLINFLGW